MITAKMTAVINMAMKLKNYANLSVEKAKQHMREQLLKDLRDTIGADEDTPEFSLHSNIEITQLEVEEQKEEQKEE